MAKPAPEPHVSSPSGRSPWIRRWLDIQPGEGAQVAFAIGFFFSTLCGYFMVRSVREAMGVEGGMSSLYQLFYATLIVMFIAHLALGGVMTRLRRSGFVPFLFRFLALNLLAFAAIRHFSPDRIGPAIGKTFYVWLSVANMFLTTLFWGLLADGFSLHQAKRLFPIIGVGGTLGAVCGSWIAKSAGLSAIGLMIGAAILWEVAVQAARHLERSFRESSGSEGSSPAGGVTSDKTDRDNVSPRIGGDAWDGVKTVARSPYLIGICTYIGCMAIGNTLLYFTQARIVAEANPGDTQPLFARIDLWTNLATLFVQLFITGRLTRVLGVAPMLLALPAVTMLGLAALAWFPEPLAFLYPVYPLYGALLLVQAIHRGTRYAVARPARELLFTVVRRRDKYRAKSFADTVCYRGGDALGTVADKAAGTLSVTVSTMPLFALPLVLLWGTVSVLLAIGQRRRLAE